MAKSTRGVWSVVRPDTLKARLPGTLELPKNQATASHDLVLQQQLVAQQLATLQAQLDLQKAQQGQKTSSTSPISRTGSRSFEQELLLLQAQRKLDDAKKP